MSDKAIRDVAHYIYENLSFPTTSPFPGCYHVHFAGLNEQSSSLSGWLEKVRGHFPELTSREWFDIEEEFYWMFTNLY